MKVSSPVGEFPFTINHVRLSRDGLIVKGQMGRWPAHIVIDQHDLPTIARYAAIAIAAASLITRLATRRSRNRTDARTRLGRFRA